MPKWSLTRYENNTVSRHDIEDRIAISILSMISAWNLADLPDKNMKWCIDTRVRRVLPAFFATSLIWILHCHDPQLCLSNCLLSIWRLSLLHNRHELPWDSTHQAYLDIDKMKKVSYFIKSQPGRNLAPKFSLIFK